MSEQKCELCGEPMPPGEEMFKFHGYSGTCPKPPLPSKTAPTERAHLDREALAQLVVEWREKARLVRPLESAPLTAKKRERIRDWMLYSTCADALDAILKGER